MVKIGKVFAKLEKAFTPPPTVTKAIEKAFTPPPLPSPSTVTKAIEKAFTTPAPLPAPSSITKAVEKAFTPTPSVTKELENAVKAIAPKPQQAPTPPQDQVQQSQEVQSQEVQSQEVQSREVQSRDQQQVLAIVNSLNFNDPYTLGIIAIIGIIVLYILKKLLFNKK